MRPPRWWRATHKRSPLARSAASGGAYGFSTADGYPSNEKFAHCTLEQVPCPSGDLLGYYQWTTGVANQEFAYMRADLPVGYMRFFVSYDDVYYWNGSQCTWSPAWTGGSGYQGFLQLMWDIQAAQADNLTPVVAFANGTGGMVTINGAQEPNPVPTVPDPGYGTSGSQPFYGFTTAGDDYDCGVWGIMVWVGAEGLGTNPVTHWEAWNEPNGATQGTSDGGGFNASLGPCTTGSCIGSPSNPKDPVNGYPYGPCGSGYYTLYNGSTVVNPCGGELNSQLGGTTSLCYSSTDQACGPLEAAELWELAQAVYQEQMPGKGFSISALTISSAQNSVYENSYIGQIVDMNACASGYPCPYSWYSGTYYPTVWSTHDYEDPSSDVANAHADISSFTTNLYNHYAITSNVWITESAVNLNDDAVSDGNRGSGCDDVEVDHDVGGSWTFGGCVDHNPAAQATGASSFLALGSYGNGETIQQTDWYEFQPGNPSPAWDSGLLAAASENGGFEPPAGGSYDAARYSLCVLDHVTTADCSAASADASDWSTDQG